jgi:type II secretion system protein C
MKSKSRFILYSLLSAFILSLAAWMIIYNGSKPSRITIHPAGSGMNGQVTASGDPSSQNRKDEIRSEAEGNKSQSDSYRTTPAELSHLKLVGTAINADKAPCAVIDNAKSHSQGLYKKDDEIDGARIIDIQNDAVILALNGTLFKLFLEKPASTEKQLKTDKLLQETPNAFTYTTQEDVEKAWDETQNLMTMIELEQHYDNGEPKGVKVEKVMPDTVFEKIGFKPGDILVQVDDMKMRIADDAMEVYNCIRTKPIVYFTIIRKGESSPLVLEYKRDLFQK